MFIIYYISNKLDEIYCAIVIYSVWFFIELFILGKNWSKSF